MSYLSHIFIMHALYGYRMYAQSIVFSHFKRKHQVWYILKKVIAILILSSSNQKMVKLHDKIKIENCLFISKYINNKLPSIFNSWFIFFSTYHNYETSFTTKGGLKIPTDTTTSYDKGTFISMATKTWHNIQSKLMIP